MIATTKIKVWQINNENDLDEFVLETDYGFRYKNPTGIVIYAENDNISLCWGDWIVDYPTGIASYTPDEFNQKFTIED